MTRAPAKPAREPLCGLPAATVAQLVRPPNGGPWLPPWQARRARDVLKIARMARTLAAHAGKMRRQAARYGRMAEESQAAADALGAWAARQGEGTGAR